MRSVLVLAPVMLILESGCAATRREKVQTVPAVCGFLGDACDDLRPGPEGGPALRYVNPTAEFTRFNKVMVEVVGFFGSDVSQVPPKDQQALTDLFQSSLTQALAKRYQIAGQAGPGTIRLQVAILDAEAATPGVRSLSMAIPQARVLTTAASVLVGKYPFAGGAQAAMKLTDATTGQVLAAGVDRQGGGGSMKAVAQWQWGDAESAIKVWSERVTDNMYAYTSGAKKP